jgi:hypothetical protein
MISPDSAAGNSIRILQQQRDSPPSTYASRCNAITKLCSPEFARECDREPHTRRGKRMPNRNRPAVHILGYGFVYARRGLWLVDRRVVDGLL